MRCSGATQYCDRNETCLGLVWTESQGGVQKLTTFAFVPATTVCAISKLTKRVIRAARLISENGYNIITEEKFNIKITKVIK